MKQRKYKRLGPERRKFLRLNAATIEYVVIGKGSSKDMSFTRDIGAGGVCIFVAENIKVGSLLALKIYLPRVEDPIEAKGKVVWRDISSFLSGQGRRHYDVGIEFCEIDKHKRKMIDKYVLQQT